MTTAAEAYLTGVITMRLLEMKTLDLKVVPTVDDHGQINGIITLRDEEDQIRFTISITEHFT